MSTRPVDNPSVGIGPVNFEIFEMPCNSGAAPLIGYLGSPDFN